MSYRIDNLVKKTNLSVLIRLIFMNIVDININLFKLAKALAPAYPTRIAISYQVTYL